jgi:4-hydroxy-2-oxoheptanedioate aldolase
VWSASPSRVGVETLGRSGIDWVLLDLQHGSGTWDEAVGLIQAIELGGAAAVVRVGWSDPVLIMKALDLGAAGIVVPMVSTPEQAVAAAQSMRYPPLGARSYGPARNPYNPADPVPPVTCLVMIETVQALGNVDEIVATPGVDGAFVGPADMGLALGLGRDPSGEHPDLIAATQTVIDACLRHGKIPAGVSSSPANAEHLLQMGMQLLTIGSDAGYIAAGAAADAARARELAARFARGA